MTVVVCTAFVPYCATPPPRFTVELLGWDIIGIFKYVKVYQVMSELTKRANGV